MQILSFTYLVILSLFFIFESISSWHDGDREYGVGIALGVFMLLSTLCLRFG